MVHRAHGGEADPVRSLHPWAVDTLNKGPALRSKIVVLNRIRLEG
jgi:hypothetical protein